MNCLITGGAGFIGGHLCAALLRRGDRVAAIDDLSTGSVENIAGLSSSGRFQFVQGDVIDSPELERLIADSDLIFHLAAAVGVELVVHDPVRTITTNVSGSERVLRLASRYGKRILLASTSEVYGKSAKPAFAETDDLLIGSPEHARWSYACSKLLDEFMLMAYCRDRGLPGTVVRLFNTVGPRQTGRYGMVIPRFVGAALADQPLRVFGTGEQTRCFCHVADVVRALLLLGDNPASAGQVYNIGSSEKISIGALARLVIERTGSRSKIELIPYSEAYAAGFEDMLHRAPDCAKIAAFCGWKPENSLAGIIDGVAASLR